MNWPPWSVSTSDTDGAESGASGGTTDAQYRWKYLSSVVAGGLALGWPAAIAFGGVDPSALDGGTWSALTGGWVLSVVYTIGTDTYRAIKQVGSSDRGAPSDGAGSDAGAGVDPVRLREALQEERDEVAQRYEHAIGNLESRIKELEGDLEDGEGRR